MTFFSKLSEGFHSVNERPRRGHGVALALPVHQRALAHWRRRWTPYVRPRPTSVEVTGQKLEPNARRDTVRSARPGSGFRCDHYRQNRIHDPAFVFAARGNAEVGLTACPGSLKRAEHGVEQICPGGNPRTIRAEQPFELAKAGTSLLSRPQPTARPPVSPTGWPPPRAGSAARAPAAVPARWRTRGRTRSTPPSGSGTAPGRRSRTSEG